MLPHVYIRNWNAAIHIDNPTESTVHIAPANINDDTILGNARSRFSPCIRMKKIKHKRAIIIPVYAITI